MESPRTDGATGPAAAPRPDRPEDPGGPEPGSTRTSAAAPDGTGAATPDWKRAYADVARISEFRALWASHAITMAGSHLLSLSVSMLVYRETQSPLAAGITITLTFLPHVLAGPLLSGLSDIVPRRKVMIACDVLRALLVAAIALPGLPVWLIWPLLFCTILPMIPFGAARAALMAQMLEGERFVASSAIINLTSHVGTLAGLLAGGWAFAVLGPVGALGVTSAAFLVSAVIIRWGVGERPAPAAQDRGRPSLAAIARDGTRVVAGDPRLRTLALMAWLAVFYMVPFGLAGPLSSAVGGGSVGASLIMAAPAMGALVGGYTLTRIIGPTLRMHLLGPLAVAGSVPLTLWVLHPPLWAMVALLAVSGALCSYQLVANAAFVLCAPESGRGQAFGLVAGGLQAAQGVGIAAAALAVEVVPLETVVAGAGVLGVAAALLLAFPWARLVPGVLERMQASSGA